MRRVRILIAADRDVLAWRLRAQLETLGHTVLGIVKNAPAAAEFAWQSPLDLIFLDQHLPPRGGIDAAREILARRIAPLVLLIGYPAAGLVKKASEAGILTHLIWPTEGRMLESAIEVAEARLRELRILYEHIGNLQEALRTRIVVRQAKKMLMRRLGLTEIDAFGYVLRHSQKAGVPVNEVAEGLLAAEDLWPGPVLVESVGAILRVLRRPGALEPLKAS